MSQLPFHIYPKIYFHREWFSSLYLATPSDPDSRYSLKTFLLDSFNIIPKNITFGPHILSLFPHGYDLDANIKFVNSSFQSKCGSLNLS